MARLRAAAVALNVYGKIRGRSPPADAGFLIPPFGSVSDASSGCLSRSLLARALSRPQHVSGWPLRDGMYLSRLQKLLEHTDSRYSHLRLDLTDGWGNPLFVGIAEDGLSYVVASGGANGRLESPVSDAPYPPSEAWRDIVLADSVFVSGPANTTW